jgi:hypothetical protein
MAVSPNAYDWEGQTVLDRRGEKIGKIEEIFLVEETGKPEWALVELVALGKLKGHTTMVPLTMARPVQDGVAVHVEKHLVEEAPEIKPDGEPSEPEVNALYRHYGLGSAQSAEPANGNGGYAAPAPTPTPAPAPVQQFSNGGSAPEAANGSPDMRNEPIGNLINTVKEEGSNLVSQELRLAKAEMSGKAKDVGIGAGMFGGAGYVASITGIALMLTIMFALDTAMKLWLAALITTVLFGAIAGVLALMGKKKIQQAGPPIPEQTVESVKQTIETVKEEAKWGLGQTR